MSGVKKGDTVTVEYEGRFESGEVFDSTSHGDHSHPLTFKSGNSEVVKGFDDAVFGMKKGEEKEVIIKPEEAYGQPNPELIQKNSKNKTAYKSGAQTRINLNAPLAIGPPNSGKNCCSRRHRHNDRLKPPASRKNSDFQNKTHRNKKC